MIYVDPPRYYPDSMIREAHTRRHGNLWSHMITDQADLTELHEMALRLGLRRRYFQDKPGFPHYDLIPRKVDLAVKYGAVMVAQTAALVRIRQALNPIVSTNTTNG